MMLIAIPSQEDQKKIGTCRLKTKRKEKNEKRRKRRWSRRKKRRKLRQVAAKKVVKLECCVRRKWDQTKGS